MRNFSSPAVPPLVSSRSRVALFLFVLSVSQCPTSDFSCSKAAAPLLPAKPDCGTASAAPTRPTARVPAACFISLLLPGYFRLKALKWALVLRANHVPAPPEFLRAESHNDPQEHPRQQDVPEQRGPRFQNDQQTQRRGDRRSGENAEQHRMHFLRNIPDDHARRETLQ